MKASEPDLLLLAETAGETISSIADKLEKSEFWVARVLGRETTCSPIEAGHIAEIIGTDPLHTSHLTVNQNPPRSPLKTMGMQILDKVVIGALALSVALVVEHNFGTLTLKRERALAVSNVNSQFLVDRYTQAKSDFVALLVQLELARQATTANVNAPAARSAGESVQVLRNQLEVDINIMAAVHPLTRARAVTFVETLRAATQALIDRRVPTDYDEKVSLLRTRFFEFSTACQQAMVEIVEAELQEVEDGRFRWW